MIEEHSPSSSIKTRRYYTEFPYGEFDCASDEEALNKSQAKLLYRENDSPNGRPFVILRNFEDK